MTALSATEQLTVCLNAVAGALAAADAGMLLAAEESLSSALAGVAGIRSVGADERRAVAGELVHARATLARCRILGRSAFDATQATLFALGRRSGDYRRGGADMPDPMDAGARGFAVERRM